MENPIKMDDLGVYTPIFGNIHFLILMHLHMSKVLLKNPLNPSEELVNREFPS